MPAKENGVQSSTISYSNVVIPDGITNNADYTVLLSLEKNQSTHIVHILSVN